MEENDYGGYSSAAAIPNVTYDDPFTVSEKHVDYRCLEDVQSQLFKLYNGDYKHFDELACPNCSHLAIEPKNCPNCGEQICKPCFTAGHKTG